MRRALLYASPLNPEEMVGILALKRPRAPFWFLIQGPSPYLINRSHHTLNSKSQKANPSPFTYVALKNTSSSAHLSNSSPSLRPLPVSLTAVYPFFESLPLVNTPFASRIIQLQHRPKSTSSVKRSGPIYTKKPTIGLDPVAS